MANLLEGLIDFIAVLFALGLSVYGFKLRQTFKGGLMEAPLKVLAPAPLLFAVGELFDVSDNLGIFTDPMGMIHISFEVLFIVALFAGFYQLSKVWNIKTKA